MQSAVSKLHLPTETEKEGYRLTHTHTHTRTLAGNCVCVCVSLSRPSVTFSSSNLLDFPSDTPTFFSSHSQLNSIHLIPHLHSISPHLASPSALRLSILSPAQLDHNGFIYGLFRCSILPYHTRFRLLGEHLELSSDRLSTCSLVAIFIHRTRSPLTTQSLQPHHSTDHQLDLPRH